MIHRIWDLVKLFKLLKRIAGPGSCSYTESEKRELTSYLYVEGFFVFVLLFILKRPRA